MKKVFLVILLMFGLCSCTKANKMKKEILEHKDFCGRSEYVIVHLTFYDDDTYDYYTKDQNNESDIKEYEIKGNKFTHLITFTYKYKVSIGPSSLGITHSEKQTLSVYWLEGLENNTIYDNTYFIYTGSIAHFYYTDDSPDSLKEKSYYDKLKNESGRIELYNIIQPRSYKNSVW